MATRPLLTAAGLLMPAAVGLAAGPGPGLPDPAGGGAVESVSAIDRTADAGDVRLETVPAAGLPYPVPARLRAVLGGGALFPVGSWAEGFDPGISLGAGVERPVRSDVELGAWVSRAEIRMEGRASMTWTAIEARAAWYLPVDLEPLSPYLTGRAGLLRSVLRAGSGREDEWNLLAGGGAGILLPLSGRYALRAEGLWRRVFAEGQGFSVDGGLLIEL